MNTILQIRQLELVQMRRRERLEFWRTAEHVDEITRKRMMDKEQELIDKGELMLAELKQKRDN